MRLDGATCLVTGANRGIGRALAAELAKRPVRLLAGVRSLDRWEPLEVAGSRVREVVPVRLDLSSREALDGCFAELGDELDAIDVLVNNAGQMTGGLLEEQRMDEIEAMVQVNLLAAIQLTQRVLPGMVARGRGTIVNNASISGYAYFPSASTYAASKAGIVAFTESLQRELRGTGVRTLQLVTPGVESDMLDATTELYSRHLDTSGWETVPAAEWARRAVEAIEQDKRVLGPGGKTALAKLASRGPAQLLDAIAGRGFSRTPRR
ncbi:SDR family NAD(P)-dependent oxidoreductase [Conexibacter stalactiti]|uniref:SDR family NAD(P)-dependent oxidoreductase n=1 Tax=Conexibacter stalactiti TaxID=1940611 RepID=A0ABU4HT80_9ACTN|nr:SDR family NAD(P)-dependent oxidoreductase [Conexibacter stalactiti]MDW5596501.1 SDR family NAD(P)-dependent oxidoreductase [Conexibacter stalactiti]MEC5037143.1 SDR family NAD(P)-dependent oxidoreductase [Conexibacter stalactiti]